MIETKTIRMEPKKMFSVLFLTNGLAWLMLALLGVGTFCCIGVIIDPRFFILALIWIFLIIPMLVAFLYFFYGMRPLTAFNTIPHRILFSSDDITICFPKENDNEDGKKECLSEEPDKEFKLSKSFFSKLKSGSDYILFFFGPKGWLWLPVGAFDKIEDFKNLITSFSPSADT